MFVDEAELRVSFAIRLCSLLPALWRSGFPFDLQTRSSNEQNIEKALSVSITMLNLSLSLMPTLINHGRIKLDHSQSVCSFCFPPFPLTRDTLREKIKNGE